MKSLNLIEIQPEMIEFGRGVSNQVKEDFAPDSWTIFSFIFLFSFLKFI